MDQSGQKKGCVSSFRGVHGQKIFLILFFSWPFLHPPLPSGEEMPSLFGWAGHQNKDGCSFASPEHKSKLVLESLRIPSTPPTHASHPGKLLFILLERTWGGMWPSRGKQIIGEWKGNFTELREKDNNGEERQRRQRYSLNLAEPLWNPVLSGRERARRHCWCHF